MFNLVRNRSQHPRRDMSPSMRPHCPVILKIISVLAPPLSTPWTCSLGASSAKFETYNWSIYSNFSSLLFSLLWHLMWIVSCLLVGICLCLFLLVSIPKFWICDFYPKWPIWNCSHNHKKLLSYQGQFHFNYFLILCCAPILETPCA